MPTAWIDVRVEVTLEDGDEKGWEASEEIELVLGGKEWIVDVEAEPTL